MGAAMPGPADERIKRFLKQRHDVQLASDQQNQLDEERQQERKRKTELIKAKWIADAQIIAEILTDLGEKLFDAGLSLVFQDTGPSDPETVASGLISGQFVGKPIELVLKVKSDGAIDVGEAASRGPVVNINFVLPAKIWVLTAHKGEYEALILDLLGVD
jgi:hypothetical protein